MSQILVTKPGILTAADRKKLRAAGIVTVEAERPEDVRLVRTEGPPMDGNDLLYAAMQAMLRTPQDNFACNVKQEFANIVARILDDQRKARQSDA